METLIGGNLWLSLVATVVLAPVAEEFIFRGVVMKKAQKLMPFMVANILQAVMFGLYHMNWIQGVYAFVIGVIFGFTAEYFHSIWVSVLLHALVNGSAQVLALLPESFGQSVWGNAGMALLGIVLLFVAAKFYPKARTEQVSEKFNENLFDEQ